MATTIQVKDETLRMLKMLKEKNNEDSYDNVIAKLAKEKLNIPDMFGTLKDESFRYDKKTDRIRFSYE